MYVADDHPAHPCVGGAVCDTTCARPRLQERPGELVDLVFEYKSGIRRGGSGGRVVGGMRKQSVRWPPKHVRCSCFCHAHTITHHLPPHLCRNCLHALGA